MVDFQFSNTITHSSQRLNITKPSNDPNVRILHPPSRAKAFGRIVLNVLSCGTYTSCYDNPRQWEEFYKALEESITPEEKDQMDKFLKTIYNEREALTQSKASNVLARVGAWRKKAQDAPATRVGGVDGGQNVLHGDGSGANVQTRDVRTLAERFFQTEDAHTESGFSQDGEIYKIALAIQNPRRAISNDAIIHGQNALKRQAASKNQSLEYTKIGLSGSSLREVVEKITENVAPISLKMDALREKGRQGESAILSIPLRLKRTSQLHEEDHLILIAVDFKTKKILYLDPKATSLDLAHKKYQEQGNNFRGELTQLGKKLFGESFESKTDILELSSPKQKRSSDAGAFTHFFTKAILDDCSPCEIDTNFGIADHAAMRSNFAQDILNANNNHTYLHHAIEEDLIPLDNLSGAKNDQGLGKYEFATEEEITDCFFKVDDPPPAKTRILKTKERIICKGGIIADTPCGINDDKIRAIKEQDMGAFPISFLVEYGDDQVKKETEEFPMRKFYAGNVDWSRFHLQVGDLSDEVQLGDKKKEETASIVSHEDTRKASANLKKERIKKMGRDHGVKSEQQLEYLTRVINDELAVLSHASFSHMMNPFSHQFKIIRSETKVAEKLSDKFIRKVAPVTGEQRAFYVFMDGRVEGDTLQIQQGSATCQFTPDESSKNYFFSEKQLLKAKIIFPEDDSKQPVFSILSIKSLMEIKAQETGDSELIPTQSL